MKIETILNALLASNHRSTIRTKDPIVRSRQFCTFRSRIIRMVEERDKEIRFLNMVIDKCEKDIKGLEESFGIYSTGALK